MCGWLIDWLADTVQTLNAYRLAAFMCHVFVAPMCVLCAHRLRCGPLWWGCAPQMTP